jgi:mycothiol synthase
MKVYTERSCESEADLDAIVALIRARAPERVSDSPSAVDLREAFAGTPETRGQTYLWEDAEGRLLAFSIQGWTHPFEIGRPFLDQEELVSQVIAWHEERARKAGEAYLDAASWDDDLERLAFLERHGFVRQAWQQGVVRMERSLHEPIPEPFLAEGYTIRHLGGEREVEALVALHRAAFGSEWMTAEFRLASMRVPDYDLGMDLVAVAPDGALAGYTTGWFSREENLPGLPQVGWTEPVAVHPAHRREGLARALMLTGFRLLRQRGVDVVRTTPWSENTAMVGAARSVGHCIRARRLCLKRPRGAKGPALRGPSPPGCNAA